MKYRKSISIALVSAIIMQSAAQNFVISAQETEPMEQEVVGQDSTIPSSEKVEDIQNPTESAPVEDKNELTSIEGTQQDEIENTPSPITEETVPQESEVTTVADDSSVIGNPVISKSKVKSYIYTTYAATVTEVVFSDVAVPEGITPTDLSEKSDQSVVGYVEGNKAIITTQVAGRKIQFPEDCTGMFYVSMSSRQITSMDFSNVDTSQVTNMTDMFYGNASLTSLDLSSFDTSNLTTMAQAFAHCVSLQVLNLSSFTVPKLQSASWLFYNCNKLVTIYANPWIGSFSIYNTFGNCPSLVGISSDGTRTPMGTSSTPTTPEGGYFTAPNVRVGIVNMLNQSGTVEHIGFYSYVNTAGTISIPLDALQAEVPENLVLDESMEPLEFTGQFQIFNLEVETLPVISKVKAKNFVFQNDQIQHVIFEDTPVPDGVGTVDLSESSDGSIVGYIDGNKGIITSNRPGFKIQLPADCSGMFHATDTTGGKDYQLLSIDLSKVYSGKVNTMYRMFYGNAAMTSINLDNFDVSNTPNLGEMFSYCEAIVFMDLRSFKPLKATAVEFLFYQCPQLTTIITPSWLDLGASPSNREIFGFCPALVGVSSSGVKKDWVGVGWQYATPEGGYFTDPSIRVGIVRFIDEQGNISKRVVYPFLPDESGPIAPEEVMNEIPAGYELVDSLPAMDISNPAQVFDIKIQTMGEQWTGSIKYMFNGQEIGAHEVSVSSKRPTVSADTIEQYIPQGYVAKNPIEAWTITDSGDELVIECKEKAWDATVNYVYDGSIVKGVTFTKERDQLTITAQEIQDGIPADYIPAQEIADLTITQDNQVFEIQVKPVEQWTGIVKYMVGGQEVGRHEFSVTNKAPEVSALQIEQYLPNGYLLKDTVSSWTVTRNGDELLVECKEKEWAASVHYVFNGTTLKTLNVIKTGSNPVISIQEVEAGLPNDYMASQPLADLIITKENEEFIIQVKQIEIWSITLNYVDDQDKVIGTKEVQVTNKNPIVSSQEIQQGIPNGYETAGQVVDLMATHSGQVFDIRVQEKGIEWTVTVNYVRKIREVVSAATFKISSKNPVVTSDQVVNHIPKGYEATGAVHDLTADQDGQIFEVEVKPVVVPVVNWKATINFVDQAGNVLSSQLFEVTDQNPVIPASSIHAVLPSGMIPVNPLQDLTVTQDGDVFTIEVKQYKPIEELWTITVNFKDEAGNMVGNATFEVSSTNPVISADKLNSQLPEGYQLSVGSDVTIPVDLVSNGVGSIDINVVPVPSNPPGGSDQPTGPGTPGEGGTPSTPGSGGSGANGTGSGNAGAGNSGNGSGSENDQNGTDNGNGAFNQDKTLLPSNKVHTGESVMKELYGILGAGALAVIGGLFIKRKNKKK